MKKIGIYVHIPFCMKKCFYCDFVSYCNKENLVDEYIECLKKEIESKKNKSKFGIDTIYIGGGTPSFINENHIKDIIYILKESFDIDKETEITIEVNPGTVNENKLEIYKEVGINRLSMGLQSTNNELLKMLGRIHTYEQFLESYNMAKNIGFKNINVDLMIGLPNQKLEEVNDSVKKVINLKPNHISVYSLILEEGTKIAKKIKKGELSLPKDELEREMYWNVKNQLQDNGYNHYEISNFAKKGFESKHNMNCWNQMEYVGIGTGAHSYRDITRYSNTEDIKEYIKNVQKGEFEKNRIIHEIQKEEDSKKEFMLLGLRKIAGIKISEFKNKFGDNPIYLYRNELKKLSDEKLIIIQDDNIRLSNKGIDLANLVWEEFV